MYTETRSSLTVFSLQVVLLASVLPGLLAEGWGPWSPWAPCTRYHPYQTPPYLTTCTRTCGEGLQARRRLCLSALQGCHGSDIAWKACGLQPCPAGSIGWRDEQCALHNNRALNGRWVSDVPQLVVTHGTGTTYGRASRWPSPPAPWTVGRSVTPTWCTGGPTKIQLKPYLPYPT